MINYRITGPVGEEKETDTPFSEPIGLIGAPPSAPCGRTFLQDLDVRIDQDGRWYYHGSAIERKELVCLFAQALARAGDGSYWLVTPSEIGRVEVEDAPFVCVEAFVNGDGRRRSISLRTNVDQIVTIDEAHPLTVVTDAATGEPRPYVGVGRGLVARLSRSVYYELVSLGGVENADGCERYGVWSEGRFFALGDLDASQ